MLAPVYDLFAAPGTGKTTLVPHLVELAPPGLAVVDLDVLLEDGALLGVPIAHPDARAQWPAYNRMWDTIMTVIRRSGTAVLVLTPVPEPSEVAGPDGWPAPAHYCLLDCDDTLRRNRLLARGWDRARVEHELADAAAGRALGTAAITVAGDETPRRTAERVLDWVASSR